jgi:ubiquinone/menaquinone biosynthesis C-methylase UbiE
MLFGAIYDIVACNSFYNRLIWGYRTSEFASVCQNALESFREGWVLDAGCGSLAFTAKTYSNYSEHPVILLDQSVRMLRRAKARLVRLNGMVPANLVFLHGDALRLPFKPKSFGTVIALNLLHVIKDVGKVLLEMRKVLADGGTMTLTTLIENNRLADKYLQILASSGKLVPRNINQLVSSFGDLGMPVKYHIKGNMAFINYK